MLKALKESLFILTLVITSVLTAIFITIAFLPFFAMTFAGYLALRLITIGLDKYDK